MNLQTMSEEEFDREVLAASGPVLVDFAAAWCAPCRALEPILVQLAAGHAEDIVLKTVDTDTSGALVERYDVRSVPTVIAFRGGREVGRAIGLMSAGRLRKRLNL
jgi:thioredoxin 1